MPRNQLVYYLSAFLLFNSLTLTVRSMVESLLYHLLFYLIPIMGQLLGYCKVVYKFNLTPAFIYVRSNFFGIDATLCFYLYVIPFFLLVCAYDIVVFTWLCRWFTSYLSTTRRTSTTGLRCVPYRFQY